MADGDKTNGDSHLSSRSVLLGSARLLRRWFIASTNGGLDEFRRLKVGNRGDEHSDSRAAAQGRTVGRMTAADYSLLVLALSCWRLALAATHGLPRVTGMLVSSRALPCSLRGPLRPPRQRDGDVTRTDTAIDSSRVRIRRRHQRPEGCDRPPSVDARRATLVARRDRRPAASIASTSRCALSDVEPADLTDALVAFLDLLTHVPGTAPNLPFMHARIAAERAAWRLDAARGTSGRSAHRRRCAQAFPIDRR